MEYSEAIVNTKDIVGVDVKNTALEDLGEITEIMLDKLQGIVRYVVLSSGGFLGLGEKLFAIPWNALHYDPENECFILNVPKEHLKQAPGFDKDHWPDVTDRGWGKTIFDFYGTHPYWDEKL